MAEKILVVGNGPINFTDEQIDYMRQDLDSGMGLTKMRLAVEERLKAEGKDFNEEFEKYKELEMSNKEVKNMALFIDLAKPDSGCALAGDMDIVAFKAMFEMTAGNVCEGCFFTDSGCKFKEKRVSLKKAAREVRFGQHDHKTNAEIAAEMGVSKRQVAKMRKRGELHA